MIIDTHSHIVEKQFNEDRSEIIERCFANDVQIINCSTDYVSSVKSLEMVRQFQGKGVYTAVGFDPQETEQQDYDEQIFEKLINENRSNIVAIGEIGLEFFKQENFEQQKEIMKSQMLLAKKYELPVIIHCRDFEDNRNNAYQEIAQIMDEVDSPYTGVVHCFSGNVEQALAFTQHGYYLGFNGIITFKKPGDTHDVLRAIDRIYILSETDAPYLAPVPFRGKRNEPLYVTQVVEKIAEILNIDILSAQKLTLENAQRLFNI